MIPDRLAAAHRLLEQAGAELAAVGGPGAGDEELLGLLTVCEGAARLLERISVGAIADLQRRGVFAERGYRSTVTALADLLGWERGDARRRLVVAEQACARVGLDGTVLPARLAATAAVFAAGECSARQVETVARVLDSAAARRLSPGVWADAERQIAARAGEYSPADLHAWGTALVELLDQDGRSLRTGPSRWSTSCSSPATRPVPAGRSRAGSTTRPCSTPLPPWWMRVRALDAADADERPLGRRQAEALADACGYVLDHGDLPATGGERPHLSVVVRLEDLESRARAACLDLGGTLTPEGLRLLACDARVVPVVLGGAGQPLDVGRATRAVPDGLRRAVAARDRGCARCGRPPSWCEIHHLTPWEHGGPTSIDNLAMVCRACHRLIHHGGWDVRLRQGRPEFLPPPWVDPQRRPRSRPAWTGSPAA